MSDKQTTLVIGLDAVESPLVQQLMASGKMPNLANLAAESVTTPVAVPSLSTLPGAIWQDILTGTKSTKHGNYYPRRVHSGEDQVRAIDSHEHVGNYFFDHIAASGLEAVVIDMPLVPSYTPPAELTLVAEWHVHDALYGRGSHPKNLIDDLEARFGQRPYDRCDTNHTTDPDGLIGFAEMLKSELSIKIDMAEHLMMEQSWDLFAIGLSQGHCAGHQLWHLHDQIRTGANDAGSRDLLVEVYQSLDSAIGRLVEAVDKDTAIVVFTSHGMENYVGGPQLLPHLLREWGYGDPRKLPSGLRRFIPRSLVQKLFRLAPRLLKLTVDAGVFVLKMTPSTTAMVVPNNRVGAIRFNLVGREPQGTVVPSELEAEMDKLEAFLRGLRHAESNQPIVEQVIRLTSPAVNHHPDLPDLVVEFRRDLGELTSVVCPEVGTVEVPIRQPDYPRTGDHTDQSRIWIRHETTDEVQAMSSIDIAPTILSLLDVPIPIAMDGQTAIRQVGES